MNRTTRSRTLLAAALIAAALPLGLAACSTAGTPDPSPTSATGIGAAWGSCMRDAGMDVPDPADDEVQAGLVRKPAAADAERFDEAASDCKQQLGIESTSTADKDKWVREYAQVASCIREHGYPDYPEQRPGALSGNPAEYPRAAEEQFDVVRVDCMAEFSPDSKTQSVG